MQLPTLFAERELVKYSSKLTVACQQKCCQGEKGLPREEDGPGRTLGDSATSLQQTGTARGAARGSPEKSRTWQLFHHGLNKGAAFLLSWPQF